MSKHKKKSDIFVTLIDGKMAYASNIQHPLREADAISLIATHPSQVTYKHQLGNFEQLRSGGFYFVTYTQYDDKLLENLNPIINFQMTKLR